MLSPQHRINQLRPAGFTLLEIMVVVVIIGLLTSMALMALGRVRETAVASRTASDLRTFAAAFEQAALEGGVWPEDGYPLSIPLAMEGALPRAWTDQAPVGGAYDWDQGVFGVTAAVSIDSPTASERVLARIDQILDDGDLTSGRFRQRTNGYMLVLEE